MDGRLAANTNVMQYDYVIVGAGLAGSILARKLAEEKNKRVLVVERREHIAGNAYDYDFDGIKVQKYGPHVFHTNVDEAFKLFSEYCTSIPYRTCCEAVIDDISTPSPFNFKTIDQFYDLEAAAELKEHIKEYYGNAPYATVVDMLECKDAQIKKFANFLYEKDYKLYTAKQWNISPDLIDPSVLKRVPIVFSYRDTYFDDKYEVMPEDGFTSWFDNILNHENITVNLQFDALNHIVVDEDKRILLFDGNPVNVIYTGAIDELFGYKFGLLPYRSLNFEFKTYKKPSFQKVAIVAYPQVEGYTRITEYTKMPHQDKKYTTVAYEYPVSYDKKEKIGNEPYYPVLTKDSQEMYEKYSRYARKFSNLILCGRLADFKYYNMDQVIMRTLDVYNKMEVK